MNHHNQTNFYLSSCLILLFSAVSIFLSSCSAEEDHRFTLLSPEETGIRFENRVEDTVEFNIINYLYFYDGGGVAVGDINNNGLPDIYFTANDGPDRLYLNKGDFQFEDITEQAGVYTDDDGWSTGVTMADVNGDGFLDIYVSRVTFLEKSGPNQLFINKGDGTFEERAAEYGLDFEGYSTQAVFFDYDLDGDLDLFLLNHTMHGENSYGEADRLREMIDPEAGDKLFRNDDGRFMDATEESGIYSSQLGYGLGVAVSDINQNGLPDIYVGNDFHEDDYLYLNNGDGTFREALSESMPHTGRSSMGNDVGDINNDLRPDILSLDMMPSDEEVFMRSGGADLKMISDTKEQFGFKPQFARNTLQLNRGFKEENVPLFSDIGFVSGVAATDWSWSALFMDMDNSGSNDIFITNGIYRRPNDLDYIRKVRSEDIQESMSEFSERDLEIIGEMPEVKIPNIAFKNNRDLTFTNMAKEWGLAEPGFSNGAAYADFNNDGTLDLVINNVNMPAWIYRNETNSDEGANYLKVRLKGAGMNTSGIGTKVILVHGEQKIYREQMPTRGFQSSVDHLLHAGLGSVSELDSLLVIWPDKQYQVLKNVSVNQTLELNQNDAAGEFDYRILSETKGDKIFSDFTERSNIDFRHEKSSFDDFRREPLIPYKTSTGGPALAVADLNGDGLDDFFIGGAKWQPGEIWLQNQDGTFVRSEQESFTEDREAEDVDAIFFDANANGLQDLYVVSGGNEKTGNDQALLDRLYINDGNGNFTKSADGLPEFYSNGGVVAADDFDGDGSVDLFVGGKSVPWSYGLSPESILLKNDGSGTFTDVTEEIASELRKVGMLNDAVWQDLSGSGFPELILAGEWMPITIFSYDGDTFTDKSESFGLAKTGGLWQSVHAADITGNGHIDLVMGNFGENSRLTASPDHPLRLYVNDFEESGQSAPIIVKERQNAWYTFESLDELMLQVRSLGQQFNSYEDFAVTPVNEMIDQQLLKEAVLKHLHMTYSVILENSGDGFFNIRKLPLLAQVAPLMDSRSGDFNGNGNTDLLLAGNLYDVKPAIGGRQDASRGLMVTGTGSGDFRPMEFAESGFLIEGEARKIRILNGANGSQMVLVARHNDGPLLFEIN